MKKIILILIVIEIILPLVCFSKNNIISPPENFEDLKEIGVGGIREIAENIWNNIKGIWQNNVLPFYQKIVNWIKINIWSGIEKLFKKEIAERKPMIEKDFQIEKKEMKEDIKTELPKTFKSLWEKFKELIK